MSIFYYLNPLNLFSKKKKKPLTHTSRASYLEDVDVGELSEGLCDLLDSDDKPKKSEDGFYSSQPREQEYSYPHQQVIETPPHHSYTPDARNVDVEAPAMGHDYSYGSHSHESAHSYDSGSSHSSYDSGSSDSGGGYDSGGGDSGGGCDGGGDGGGGGGD